ncbi:MAG: aminotransferase class V-fold PLP-dependent enzyme, partial [Anaerolineae bacterium]|nr:aminotransferase class V-fold PLP-dependent enzyme [Anaerolineae bacterium]
MTDETLKAHFLLDPEVVYLNHGSYGACPRPVFERYQAWQLELEHNPVHFLGTRLATLLADARAALGAYLGVSADDLVYFSNPTTAIRLICRSLQLSPGDEILTTDWEYPSVNSAWDLTAYLGDVKIRRQPVPVPFTTPEMFVDSLWAGVSSRTRIISISHISFSNALIFPVAEVCKRAREAGILTFIDGAHAPSQIPLNLTALDADVYLGACHKWLCAPKGAGFAYAHLRVHAMLTDALIRSNPNEVRVLPEPGQFVPQYQYQGTRDPAAFLSVPEAIHFQAEHDWEAQRHRCHALASQTLTRITGLTGLAPLSPDSSDYFSQMVCIPVPSDRTTAIWEAIKARNIVVPLLGVHDRHFLRVSFQAYN